jgi:hypothetical protein
MINNTKEIKASKKKENPIAKTDVSLAPAEMSGTATRRAAKKRNG